MIAVGIGMTILLGALGLLFLMSMYCKIYEESRSRKLDRSFEEAQRKDR